MVDRQPGDARSADEVVREAFSAFAQGDRSAIVAFLDRDFRWTYFNPDNDAPIAETCTVDSESFRWFIANSQGDSAQWRLVELVPFGARVVVVTKPPKQRQLPSWRSGDHMYHVVEVRDGRIVAMRACLSRDEAVHRAEAKDESLTI